MLRFFHLKVNMKKFFILCLVILNYGCGHFGSKHLTIAILPLGLNQNQEYLIDEIKESIMEKKEFDVVVLKDFSLPQSAWYEPRKRYHANKIILHLKKIKPDSVDYILALTSEDISITKGGKDWGIFGLGYEPGVASVVSTFRLGNNKKLLTKRILKITKHELGHNFGLPHCKNSKTCVMHSAEGSIKTVDRVHNVFCKKCQDKLSR